MNIKCFESVKEQASISGRSLFSLANFSKTNDLPQTPYLVRCSSLKRGAVEHQASSLLSRSTTLALPMRSVSLYMLYVRNHGGLVNMKERLVHQVINKYIRYLGFAYLSKLRMASLAQVPPLYDKGISSFVFLRLNDHKTITIQKWLHAFWFHQTSAPSVLRIARVG